MVYANAATLYHVHVWLDKKDVLCTLSGGCSAVDSSLMVGVLWAAMTISYVE